MRDANPGGVTLTLTLTLTVTLTLANPKPDPNLDEVGFILTITRHVMSCDVVYVV